MQAPAYRYVSGRTLTKLLPLLNDLQNSAWQDVPEGFGTPYHGMIPTAVPFTVEYEDAPEGITPPSFQRSLALSVLVVADFGAPVVLGATDALFVPKDQLRYYYYPYNTPYIDSEYSANQISSGVADHSFYVKQGNTWEQAPDTVNNPLVGTVSRYLVLAVELTLHGGGVGSPGTGTTGVYTPVKIGLVVQRFGIIAQQVPQLHLSGGCGSPIIGTWEPTIWNGYGMLDAEAGLYSPRSQVLIDGSVYGIGAFSGNRLDPPGMPAGLHTAQIRVAGYTDQYSNVVSFRIGNKPSAPTNVWAEPDDVTRLTQLSWDAVSGAQRYVVRRDGVKIAETSGSSWRDEFASAAGIGGAVEKTPSHVYGVAAVNGCGEGPEGFAAGRETVAA